MNEHLLMVTAAIVSAQVANNSIEASGVADLIKIVHRTLAELGVVPVAAAPIPAVPLKRSVFPDYIVCLEDGRRLKTLRRHLQRAYGLSPAQYRAKWGLPDSYPMVAPNYSVKRSVIAKSINLGHSRARAAAAEVATTVVVKARRARKQRVNILPGD
jgi:predicted transcriptional regulator